MTAQCAGAPREDERFVHEALIYGSDDELLAVAVPFLRAGAAAGDPTLVAVAAPQQRALLQELGDLRGITPLDQGQYDDPLATLKRNRAFFAQLASSGARRIRIVGEIPHDASWRGWLRYEAAANEVFAPFPVSAICAYDARAVQDDVLVDVARTHPYLATSGGQVVQNRRYEPPAALLAERARADADPLEALTPELVLADPEAATAARAVSALAAGTRLGRDSADALRLSVAQVVTNASVHGRRPVRLRAWAALDRVVVTVTDAGRGPADPYVGLLPREPDTDPEDANALHLIHQALSDVSLFTGPDGFTVRLVERCSA